MPIVINDFEIVTEPPEPIEVDAPATPPEQVMPRPQDVIRIQRREKIRQDRVWAD